MVPFGPVARGPEGYQKIIKLRLEKFIKANTNAKANQKFREIVVDNEDLVLARIEERVYGNGATAGTNITAVNTFFQSTLYGSILSASSNIGDASTTKINFADQNGLYLRFAKWVEQFNKYQENVAEARV